MKTFLSPLTPEEEKECIERMKEGDLKAKHQLIEHNLRLVAHVAKKYQASDEDMEDLISIGTIGLIKAVGTFKTDKQIKLATYAARCIDNELLMYFRGKKKTSREVSLYEPIGTDKEGNQINLLDIAANGGVRKYQKTLWISAADTNGQGRTCHNHAVWSLRGRTAYTAGSGSDVRNLPLLCQPDRKKGIGKAAQTV